jgi:hypothetical protein
MPGRRGGPGGPDVPHAPRRPLAADGVAAGYERHPWGPGGIPMACLVNAAAADRARQSALSEMWRLLALWHPTADLMEGDAGENNGDADPPSTIGAAAQPQSGAGGSGGGRAPQMDEPAADAPTAPAAPPRRPQPRLVLVGDDDPLGDPPAVAHGHVPTQRAVAELLEHCCEDGDVQTCCTVLLVLRATSTTRGVDPDRAAAWFLAYVDLLHQRQLFVVAADVIKGCPYPKVALISTVATRIGAACRACGEGAPPGTLRCGACRGRLYGCAVCHRDVRGLFVWNPLCGHGGHLRHLRDWGTSHPQCPSCGVDAPP